MSKFLGLMGTHGSGKTTLAQAYADKHPGTTFIKTSVSDVYKSFDLDPKVRMTLERRMEVQEKVLAVLLQQWEDGLLKHNLSDSFIITDRTPFDLIGYTLAEVSGYDDISDELSQRITGYLLQCKLAAQAFDGVIHVPINLPMVADPTGKVRAASSFAYRLHLDMLMTKSVLDAGTSMHRVFSNGVSDRVKEVERAFENTVQMPI
uniref:Thymidylate kinase n=1 Tax=Pseudomonas phage Nican01 TaxID=3138540 RepID=A0AAU6W0L1_9CAUD